MAPHQRFEPRHRLRVEAGEIGLARIAGVSCSDRDDARQPTHPPAAAPWLLCGGAHLPLLPLNMGISNTDNRSAWFHGFGRWHRLLDNTPVDSMTSDRNQAARKLLAFYLEAGVD